jgi:two-component system, cell cycle sensor histidine kinase and response regulator CckA
MNNSAVRPNHRILIIDDNPAIHADFRKILCPANTDTAKLKGLEEALFDEKQTDAKILNFELDSAFQGEEGLEKVKQSLAENRPYALAFVDVRMPPGWDGAETIARIWEVFPQLQIVVCSAYSDYSWEELRRKVGQPDNLLVLKKPFDNIEVQQLAHALTKKWLLGIQANYQLAELEAMVERRTAELTQTNALLKATEERFSKAFQASPIPSGILSLPQRNFVDVNERFENLTGYRRENLIGRGVSQRIRWEQPELPDQWFARLTRNEEVREEIAKIRSQSDEVRDVLVSLMPMALGGQPHVLFLAQDISERLLLERQLIQAQKMEGIGQLAAGVAHDFNNILTVILGYAGMIKSQIENSRPKVESVEHVIKAATRATGLIRQLLLFSRKQVTQLQPLDLNESVDNALAMVGRLVGEHIHLTFSPATSQQSIQADPTMIEQVVMNLAVNARDAMPHGGKINIITSVVTMNRAETPLDPQPRCGQFVCLTFTDTGCGMSPEVLNRIFEPFFTTKGVGKGTGLGLSTVFGIMRQHDGWVEVTSKPGQGTSFRLYFPAFDKLAEQKSPLPEPVVVTRGHETILVAEDEEPLREMISMALAGNGYTVFSAATGVEALEIYDRASQPIDLLITDMIMPGGVLGAELARRLQEKNPSLKVIFSTGYSADIAGKDISLHENQKFLLKPYTVEKLSQFVREVLDQPLPK